jgi:hypothetical protein
VSKTQFLSEHGRATKLASSSSLGDVWLMSSLVTAHDVHKQPGLTSICGMSDVVKVSVIARSLSSTQQAFFIAHRRRPLKFLWGKTGSVYLDVGRAPPVLCLHVRGWAEAPAFFYPSHASRIHYDIVPSSRMRLMLWAMPLCPF